MFQVNSSSDYMGCFTECVGHCIRFAYLFVVLQFFLMFLVLFMEQLKNRELLQVCEI